MAGSTTIRQPARLSGVPVGTVCRALDRHPDVAPETRARILRLATELEHTPAAAVRTLTTQRAHVLVVGVLGVLGVLLETSGDQPQSGREAGAATPRRIGVSQGQPSTVTSTGRPDRPGFDGARRRDRELVHTTATTRGKASCETTEGDGAPGR